MKTIFTILTILLLFIGCTCEKALTDIEIKEISEICVENDYYPMPVYSCGSISSVKCCPIN